jgi:hypothetical protein
MLASGRFVRVVLGAFGIAGLASAAVAQVSDQIFADGFEDGTLSAWSSASTGGGDATVAAEAALDSTSLGLRLLVNDTTGLYVEDDSPEHVDRYRARFFFDPVDFDPGESQGHARTRIFIAFEQNPTRRLMAVVLRRVAGAYSLMVRARLDDNSQRDTLFFSITNAPHSVEVDWRRSSGAAASDGGLRLWIDGQLVSDGTGLDNSFSAVDFVRMGALSVKAGASGTLYFDELLSSKQFPPDAVTPGVGGVVITELMPNPAVIADTDGEWIELYNPGNRTALLPGCQLTSQAAQQHTISSVAIRPGVYATLARSAFAGFTPDELFGLSFVNVNGSMTLSCGATSIDTVTWASSTSGVSRQVIPIHLDAVSNDDESNWCPGFGTYVNGNLGSPGQANVCP